MRTQGTCPGIPMNVGRLVKARSQPHKNNTTAALFFLLHTASSSHYLADLSRFAAWKGNVKRKLALLGGIVKAGLTEIKRAVSFLPLFRLMSKMHHVFLTREFVCAAVEISDGLITWPVTTFFSNWRRNTKKLDATGKALTDFTPGTALRRRHSSHLARHVPRNQETTTALSSPSKSEGLHILKK